MTAMRVTLCCSEPPIQRPQSEDDYAAVGLPSLIDVLANGHRLVVLAVVGDCREAVARERSSSSRTSEAKGSSVPSAEMHGQPPLNQDQDSEEGVMLAAVGVPWVDPGSESRRFPGPGAIGCHFPAPDQDEVCAP